MSQPKESLVERVLGRLADGIYRYPRIFFYPQVVLFFLSIWYTVTYLQFDTNRDSLVGANKKYHQNYLKLKEEFPVQDDFVVVVQSESPEKNRQFVERLGARMDKETNFFTDVFYKGDLRMMGNKALLFAKDEDLEGLQKTLGDYRPFIDQFTKATNLISLFDLINKQIATAKRETNTQNTAMIKAIPALERIINMGTDALNRPGTPVSPGITALFGGPEAERELYITFAKGQIYLVTARPKSQVVGPDAIQRLRELVSQTQFEVPGLNVGVTGELILEVDEMAQSQADSTLATIVALVLCVMIFVYGYQQLGRPLKANVCLIVGIGYTMGFTTLTVGHLNILTITFVPILIGLAIDFGVHLISRYEEELQHGHTDLEALRKAIVYTGQGIFTGAFTTAGAFFAMGIADFKGIQEMGIICGGGLMLCLVPMMTLLPVLLLRGHRNRADMQAVGSGDKRARLERIWLDRPYTTIGITVTTCLLAATQFSKVKFDYNLLHMQSDGLPAVEYGKKLINSGGKSVLFCASVADNLEQAHALEQKFTNLADVATVESLTRFLYGDQTRKLELIRQIKKDIATIDFPLPDPNPVDLSELSRTLYSTYGYIGNIIVETTKEAPEIAKQMQLLHDDAIVSLRKALNSGDRDPAQTAEKLGAYQRAFFEDLHAMFDALQNQDDRDKLQVKDLPLALRNRFVGKSGKYLLQVFPKTDVWERKAQEEFVRQVRTVDANATGTPVQLLEYTTLLKDSYLEAAVYALIAIAILVFIHFRSILCVFLALLPVAIGTIWMIGMMGLRDVMFNPANIMVLPLVIGIGVTNGIHVLNRFAEERHPSIFARSTGKAVIVSGLTTIAGFGSLVLGKHQGISSLGFVMSIGVATCMLAGVTFLPAVLTVLHRRGWNIKKPSDDNAQSPLGREEPR